MLGTCTGEEPIMFRHHLVRFFKTFAAEFVSAAKQAPAIYFAPLRGAINAVKAQARKA